MLFFGGFFFPPPGHGVVVVTVWKTLNPKAQKTPE